MDRNSHNDRLRDLYHNSHVAVTEFILLISEHLSNRVVSDVNQSPCWTSGRRDNQYCCIVLSTPLATAWPERGFSTLCRVKTKQRNCLFDVTLNALINVSMNCPESLH